MVAQPADQCRWLRRNRYGVIAITPQLGTPIDQPEGFASHVAVYKLHKSSELLLVVRRHDEVDMIGGHHDRVDVDRVLFLGTGQDADDDSGKMAGCGKEEHAPEGSDRHLDGGSRWQEQKWSGHRSSPFGHGLGSSPRASSGHAPESSLPRSLEALCGAEADSGQAFSPIKT